MIDIIVMTKDDGFFLKRCVDSIIETVSIEYRIFIVDNNSSTALHLNILNDLEKIPFVHVCRNRFNLWVLGLNKTLEKLYKEGASRYFLLTDADIVFPKKINGSSCWLDYLVNKMNNNTCIGKLGLSLDWSILSENIELNYILKQEQSLYSDRMISEQYISPVDTTVALYRWNWSIAGNYKFYPLHMTYLRPELYSCRTPRELVAEHLGWQLYCNDYSSSESFNLDLINSKVFCFSVVAGDLKNTTLSQSSKRFRFIYFLIKKPMKFFWVIKRVYHGVYFHFRNCLRKYDNT